MASTKKEPVRIVEVTVKNFRRISFAHVILDGIAGLIRITGKNKQGKSSLEKAIRDTLIGPRGMTGTPLKEGEAEGFAKLLLTNGFIITRTYDADHPKGELHIQGPEGGRWGQSDIDKWLGKATFDPLSFFDMDAGKRAAALLATSGDDQLPVELAKLRARKENLKNERTPHIVAKNAAKSVAEPEGFRPEPVDVAGEMERLAQLRQAREAYNDEVERIGEMVDALDQTRRQIASVEQQLAELRRDEEADAQRLEQMRADFAELVDPTPAIEAIETAIKDADVVREQLKPWTAFDDAQAKLATEGREIEQLDHHIATIDTEISQMLANAKLPIPDLTFNLEGEPLMGGRPYEDWSGAERIRCATAVAIAAEPQLRVALLDEANDLDLDAMAALEQLAKEHDFQIWMCRIGLEGAGEVHFEDGKTV